MSDLDGRTPTDRWLGSMSAPDSGYSYEARGRATEALRLLERLRARLAAAERVVAVVRIVPRTLGAWHDVDVALAAYDAGGNLDTP